MKRLSILLFFITSTQLQVFSQPGDPGGGGNPSVPISGLEILIGAGGALGLKKVLEKRKSK